MATIQTDQGLKDVIAIQPTGRYQVRIVWDIDPATLVPVNVRIEYVF